MELLELLNWNCLFFFLMGMGAFIFSTLGGGGGSLIMVPISTWLIGANLTPQTLNTGNFLQRPSRLILYWKSIHWDIVWYYVPSSLVGSVLGAWLLADLEATWVKLIVGTFLISTIFQFKLGRKERTFKMRKYYFIPLAFIISFVSTMVGAMGPILNPFYLNAGMEKEAMIGTKTANAFFMGIIQIGSYTFFGAMNGQIWVYAVAVGIGATIGNVIAKNILANLTSRQFRQWVMLILLASGMAMIAEVIMDFW